MRGWRLRKAGPILSLLRTFLPLRWFAFNPRQSRRPRAHSSLVGKGGVACFHLTPYVFSHRLSSFFSRFSLLLTSSRCDITRARGAVDGLSSTNPGFAPTRRIDADIRTPTLAYLHPATPRFYAYVYKEPSSSFFFFYRMLSTSSDSLDF